MYYQEASPCWKRKERFTTKLIKVKTTVHVAEEATIPVARAPDHVSVSEDVCIKLEYRVTARPCHTIRHLRVGRPLFFCSNVDVSVCWHCHTERAIRELHLSLTVDGGPGELRRARSRMYRKHD